MFVKIKKIARHLVDAVFPRHCISCGLETFVLCPKCRSSWSPACPPLAPGRVATFFYADSTARALICDWKFSFDLSSRDELFRQLKTRLGPIKKLAKSERVEAICCVPLHKVKKKLRGFDQAEDIGHFISRKTHTTFLPLLVRTRATTSQADKKVAQRGEIILHNPFAINPAFVVPKCVLLVDDVWTTGSTVAAATEILKKAGVARVIVYTVAQG